MKIVTLCGSMRFKAHYKKIDMADAVYIVNIGGYIGEAVREELRYAQTHNKV